MSYYKTLITYMQPNHEYSFDEILNIFVHYHTFRSNYVFSIGSKKSYIISALKKAIDNDKVIKIEQPGARTKYTDHYYKLL